MYMNFSYKLFGVCWGNAALLAIAPRGERAYGVGVGVIVVAEAFVSHDFADFGQRDLTKGRGVSVATKRSC